MKIMKTTALLIAAAMLFSACNSSGGKEDITTAATESASEQTTKELSDVVLNSVEFPATISLEDVSVLTDTIGLNLDDIEEYTVTQQMLSVDVVEIIIAKVKDGKMNAVLETLEDRKEALKTTYAFYPQQVESAEATVVGNKGQFAYLICHKDAATAEKALTEAIA